MDLNKIAQASAGLAGADLANIERGALMAVRGGRKAVSQADFEEAIEKSVAGLERKSGSSIASANASPTMKPDTP